MLPETAVETFPQFRIGLMPNSYRNSDKAKGFQFDNAAIRKAAFDLWKERLS
jgi:hypothetical protein